MNVKKICALLLLCAILLSVFASCKSKSTPDHPDFIEYVAEEVLPDNSFRVMSFNIQTSIKGVRQEAVLHEISLYQPDLLGLQEDNPTWINAIGTALSDHTLVCYTAASTDTTERCAIFVSNERYELIDSGSTWLSDDGSKKIALNLETMPAEALQPFKDAGFKFTKDSDLTQTIYGIAGDKSSGNYGKMIGGARPMTWVVLKDKQSGEKLLYVNTHVQHRGALHPTLPTELRYVRELERIAQWNFLLEDLQEIKSKHGELPTIVTGDLNEVSGSNSYKAYTSAFDDSSKLALVYKGTDGTWNNAYNSSYNGQLIPHDDSKIGVTSQSEGVSEDAIDYCLVTPNAFTVHQFEVASGIYQTKDANGKDAYVYVSDHKALVVDLSIGVTNAPKALQLPGNELPGSLISSYSGTPDNAWFTGDKEGYVLVNADQLMGFFELRAQGNSFEGVTVRLGANMVYSNVARPAVSADSLFKGRFEGDGHYIKGLIADGGLFGVLSNATVKDLALVGCSATVGAFASEIASGATAVLYNLYSDCQVTGADAVGGLIGKINADATAELNYCTFAGSVSATGNRVGGLIGEIADGKSSLLMTNCLNKGNVQGGDMTGGLIGYSCTPVLTVSSCVSLGTVTATRCSGGLIGTINLCDALTLSNCVVNADLDFSAIGNGGSEANPVSVPAGCQVGGLIGRTYGVKGYVTDCLISGTMKATKNVKTELDIGTTGDDHNYLASGGIVGFNSQYANPDEVANGTIGANHLHFDTIMVSLKMTDVASVFGGTRDFPVNGLSSHRLSWARLLVDSDNKTADTMFGWRIQKDRLIDSSSEKDSQVEDVLELTNEQILQWNAENMNGYAYYRWIFNESISHPVPNVNVDKLLKN